MHYQAFLVVPQATMVRLAANAWRRLPPQADAYGGKVWLLDEGAMRAARVMAASTACPCAVLGVLVPLSWLERHEGILHLADGPSWQWRTPNALRWWTRR